MGSLWICLKHLADPCLILINACKVINVIRVRALIVTRSIAFWYYTHKQRIAVVIEKYSWPCNQWIHYFRIKYWCCVGILYICAICYQLYSFSVPPLSPWHVHCPSKVLANKKRRSATWTLPSILMSSLGFPVGVEVGLTRRIAILFNFAFSGGFGLNWLLAWFPHPNMYTQFGALKTFLISEGWSFIKSFENWIFIAINVSLKLSNWNPRGSNLIRPISR